MRFDYTDECNEAINAAWNCYVWNNGLLSELRALTAKYPFSNECLDDAKWRVLYDDNQSRNYCWLILDKIKKEYVKE